MKFAFAVAALAMVSTTVTAGSSSDSSDSSGDSEYYEDNSYMCDDDCQMKLHELCRATFGRVIACDDTERTTATTPDDDCNGGIDDRIHWDNYLGTCVCPQTHPVLDFVPNGNTDPDMYAPCTTTGLVDDTCGDIFPAIYNPSFNYTAGKCYCDDRGVGLPGIAFNNDPERVQCYTRDVEPCPDCPGCDLNDVCHESFGDSQSVPIVTGYWNRNWAQCWCYEGIDPRTAVPCLDNPI